MPEHVQEAHAPVGFAAPVLPRPVGEPERLKVSIDNNHCELFGLCQQEAPTVFDLGPDGRLRYDANPKAADGPAVRQAARVCPMQAITLREAR
ncbi:ferredoxin [Kitasatospora sp. RB6PN24]|uniref:ferredoxin n=1 Tax=Kitasatospora humi TaxID=2893891 RepID=UPI001E61F687|nr:ferredoxin [Kitasatospora humi]MCC9311577.1 ferredoxin [Kitasatospora humi]